MTDFEFDLIFALPEGDLDVFELSDAIFEAGFEDAVVGTGHVGLLAVALEAEGEDAESVIVRAAKLILQHLPKGSALREVRPDLVSLADVAKRLNIKRQALQKREMPQPTLSGYYRVTEVAELIVSQVTRGRRKARFDVHIAEPWFAAGSGAQCVNARIALGQVDPASLTYTGKDKDEVPPAYQVSASQDDLSNNRMT